MTYRTLMVHLDLSGDNQGVLAVAADLAKRFDAKVIGIAACQPAQSMATEGFYGGEVEEQERAEIASEISQAEVEFRAALDGKVKTLEWRSAITYASLADFIAGEARAVDLIITGKDMGPSLLDNTRRVNIGDLTMRAGRPVLLVPQGIRALPLRNVFVGWKESREARRAVADALPVLNMSQSVTVMEAVSEDRHQLAKGQITDVIEWLGRHGVTAAPKVTVAMGGETGFLRAALLESKCDLLVAGAYGHARASEWIFGGVTRDFLLDPDFCVLLSH